MRHDSLIQPTNVLEFRCEDGQLTILSPNNRGLYAFIRFNGPRVIFCIGSLCLAEITTSSSALVADLVRALLLCLADANVHTEADIKVLFEQYLAGARA